MNDEVKATCLPFITHHSYFIISSLSARSVSSVSAVVRFLHLEPHPIPSRYQYNQTKIIFTPATMSTTASRRRIVTLASRRLPNSEPTMPPMMAATAK